jgi:hypothetical protein
MHSNLLSAAADAFLTPYVVLLQQQQQQQQQEAGLRLRNHFFTKRCNTEWRF